LRGQWGRPAGVRRITLIGRRVRRLAIAQKSPNDKNDAHGRGDDGQPRDRPDESSTPRGMRRTSPTRQG